MTPTPNMCTVAWALWELYLAAKGTPDEQAVLAAYLAHRMAENRDNPCHIDKEQAIRIRDAGKQTIEGKWK